MRRSIIVLISLLYTTGMAAQGWEKTQSEQKPDGKWYHAVQVVGLMGQTAWESFQGGYGFEYAFGHQITPWLDMGIGAGFNLFGSQESERLAPVFAECRIKPLRGKFQPFLHLDSGYGFAWKDQETLVRAIEGGWRYNAGLGMIWPSRSGRIRLITEAGYISQQSQVERDLWAWWRAGDQWIREQFRYQRWVVRVGFVL